MRVYTYPARLPRHIWEFSPDSFTGRNTFPEHFAELFRAVGWSVIDGGDSVLKENDLTEQRCWEYWEVNLGIFHWGWDTVPNEQLENLWLWLKKKPTRKVMWVAHEYAVNESDARTLRALNRLSMLQNADYIVALNEVDAQRIASDMAKVSSKAELVIIPHVMPNTLVRDYFEFPFSANNNARLFGPWRISKKTFCFYGSARPNKGILLLMRTWNNIRRSFPDWKLELYAQYVNETAEIYEEIRSLENEQCTWYRDGYLFLPNQRGEFAILPYLKCNNSGVIHEMLSYECPVYASNLRPLSEATFQSDSVAELIVRGIEDCGTEAVKQDVRKKKAEMLRQNVDAKKKLLELATKVILNVYEAASR